MNYISIATEDELSETVVCRLLRSIAPELEIANRLGKKGSGYLRSKMPNFCQMARRIPVLVLTDLDRVNCATELVDAWCTGLDVPDNLHLRVAVREVESWLMADAIGFAQLLGIPVAKVPVNPDSVGDPKELLLNLARKARRDVRIELIAARGALAAQGIGYNRVLCDYAETAWSWQAAAERSDSLARTIAKIRILAGL